MRYRILTPLLLSFLLTQLACSDRQKMTELDNRERDLQQREKQFARKEADYQSLLSMRDSLLRANADTIRTTSWPETLSGSWSCKMICTESNCTNYVVGDQRTDIWEFSGDTMGIYTKVISNNQVLRTYKARYDSTGINLRFETDTSAAKMVMMKATLQQIAPGSLKGTQTTTIDNGCTATFTVELNRPSN